MSQRGIRLGSRAGSHHSSSGTLGVLSGPGSDVDSESTGASGEGEGCDCEDVSRLRVLPWMAFIAYVSAEVWIHAVHGIKEEIFNWEEAALEDCPNVYLCVCSKYLTFAEGVCRVSLFMMLVVVVARWVDALCKGRAQVFLEDLFRVEASSGCVVILATVCSLATLCVGTWGTFAADEDALPLWCQSFCHFAEILCHAIVTSGLVGLALDFGVACRSGNGALFIARACACLDTVESHSVVSLPTKPQDGTEEPATDSDDYFAAEVDRVPTQETAGACASPFRTILLWLSFVFGTSCYVLAERGRLWEPLVKTMVWLGVVCWAGIAWWIVVNIFFLQSVVKCVEFRKLRVTLS